MKWDGNKFISVINEIGMQRFAKISWWKESNLSALPAGWILAANWPAPIDRNCIFKIFLLPKCAINCNKSYKKWKCSILIFSSLTQSATCLLKYFLCVPHKPRSKYLTWRFGSRCWTSEQIPEHRSETCAMCGEQIIILIDGYSVINYHWELEWMNGDEAGRLCSLGEVTGCVGPGAM